MLSAVHSARKLFVSNLLLTLNQRAEITMLVQIKGGSAHDQVGKQLLEVRQYRQS